MARVTDAEVKEILDTDIDTTPFITTATLVVTEDLADEDYSSARLKEIELYLAAHYATLLEPQLQATRLGDASDTYQGQTGKYLEATKYGQQVQLLDTSGILTENSKPRTGIEFY